MLQDQTGSWEGSNALHVCSIYQVTLVPTSTYHGIGYLGRLIAASLTYIW